MNIDIFDPVLCCATGVCGPQVDPTLVRIAGDLRWAEENGITVRRFNLGQNPAAFVQHEAVRAELSRLGEAALPLVLVEGRIALRGRYPTRDELEAWRTQKPVLTKGTVITPNAGCGCQGTCG